jgi:TonB family protein
MRFHTVSVLLSLTLAAVVFVDTATPAQQPSEAGRKLVNHVAPRYPELARKMQISGTVKVEAIVAANGKVKSTKVIGGSPLLTKAALDAIEAWKWAATPSESKELIELTFRPE